MQNKVLLSFIYYLFNVQTFLVEPTQVINTQAHTFREPSYIILAPRVIRPADKVKISCTIFNKIWVNVIVKAIVFTDDDEIASGYQELMPFLQNTITMKLPNMPH